MPNFSSIIVTQEGGALYLDSAVRSTILSGEIPYVLQNQHFTDFIPHGISAS
jgi:hypothetical protein